MSAHAKIRGRSTTALRPAASRNETAKGSPLRLIQFAVPVNGLADELQERLDSLDVPIAIGAPGRALVIQLDESSHARETRRSFIRCKAISNPNIIHPALLTAMREGRSYVAVSLRKPDRVRRRIYSRWQKPLRHAWRVVSGIALYELKIRFRRPHRRNRRAAQCRKHRNRVAASPV